MAAAGGVTARLHDHRRAKSAEQQILPAAGRDRPPSYRLEVHRVSDEIARWASGTPGRSRHPFPVRLRRPGIPGRQRRRAGAAADAGGPDRALADVVARRASASRTPDSRADAAGSMVQPLSGRRAQVAPGAQSGLNITPAFAPDGRTLAFAHSDETGTDIYHRELRRSLLRATLDRGTLR